jgi:GTP-binding protein HflX
VAEEVFGNTRGLATADKKAVQRLFERSVDAREIISLDLAREMVALAEKMRRRVGVLINRQGRIEAVMVGTKEILYLPDLGRYRLSRSRLRNLRFVFTDLSKNRTEASIPYDIFADLERLRFDMVVSLRNAPNRVSMSFAYLVPEKGADAAHSRTETVRDLGAFKSDFLEKIEEIEQGLQSEIVVLDSDAVGAVLVGVYDPGNTDYKNSLAELRELARTAGITIMDEIVQRRRIDPRTFIGSGKLEELVLRCLRIGGEMLIFDSELKPSQWRSIINSTELKVLDRSMLILDIFAQRARSSDGRLQVELAQLKYNLPRLVEKDGGLSRLSGGIGGRGPGETKLEVSRRRVRDRISELEKRLGKVRQSRDFRRSRRRQNQIQLVSIVGYTNVGKSTLFNALTKSSVLAEDKLFATLDPSQRKLFIPRVKSQTDEEYATFPGRSVVLSDTVGFIRALPVELESAFRATLEELYDASLLLHVVDAADPEAREKYQAVRRILDSMELGDIPELVVANKVDQLERETDFEWFQDGKALSVSALRREGFEDLLVAIDGKVPETHWAANQ